MRSEQLDKGEKRVPEDAEMAVEALDAPGVVKPTAPDLTWAKGQSQDSTRGQCGSYSPGFWLGNVKDVILSLSLSLC